MDKASEHFFVLILAGGGGTRLWPMSRDKSPKQFIDIFEGKTLFKLALERAKLLTTIENIFVSTSEKYGDLVVSEAKDLPVENIIREPMRRDTALAEGVGATYIYKRDPSAVIFNLTSDHLINPVSMFKKQMTLAGKLAYETGQFTAIGIEPTFPNTGMGHIRARKPWIVGNDEVLMGEKFVEKPPLEIAEKYTDSGEYYWNAHLFVWKAKVFLDLLKKYAPKTYAQLPKLMESIGTDNERSTLQQVFQMAPTVATDYAVAENLTKFICIPAKFEWSDVGDWSETWKQLDKDKNGNVILGDNTKTNLVAIESKNNIIITDKKLLTLSHVNDSIVVDTSDAILICPKKDAQSVKKIVEHLKEQSLTQYL